MIALLAQLKSVCGSAFNTYSRAFIPWEELVQLIGSNAPAGALPAFPALYLYDGAGFGAGGTDEWVQKGRGLNYIRTIERTIVLYNRKAGGGTPGGIPGDPAFSPGSSILQPLVENVEAAMTTYDNKVTNYLTLGGLVHHCWIEGRGVMVPGDLDPSGLAMQTIPVKIMIP